VADTDATGSDPTGPDATGSGESGGITTCAVCGAKYLNTTLTACADCGAPFGAVLLAEGGEEVGYDLADWDDTQRAELAASLARDGIAHRWEDAEMVVAEADADHVEGLVDAIDNPDVLAEEDDDGDLAADVLSALYVSSDVLQSDPTSPAAVIDLLDAIEQAPELPPYGIEGSVWGLILDRANAVAELLAPDVDAEDEAIAAAAHALRELVRPLV
jgi:hypothetical protein